MTICPKCERPIKTGQVVRGEFICDFEETPGSVMHGVKIIDEVWLEHETCQYDHEGD